MTHHELCIWIDCHDAPWAVHLNSLSWRTVSCAFEESVMEHRELWIAMMCSSGLPRCAEANCHVQMWIAMCRCYVDSHDRQMLCWLPWWADAMLIAMMGRCFVDCHDGQMLCWLVRWTEVMLIAIMGRCYVDCHKGQMLCWLPWWEDAMLIAMTSRCYVIAMMGRRYIDCHARQIL